MVLDDAPRSGRGRVVLVCSSTSFILASIAILYFHKFPVLISPFVSNAIIILILVAWTVALFISSLAATGQKQVGLTLSGIWLYGFVIRSVTTLRLGVPFLHDSYFYMVSTQNILGSATLSPTLSGFFPQVVNLLPWPLMQLETVSGASLTGVGASLWYGFQEPALGSLTSVATFLLARTSTKRTDASLVAAIFVASSDAIIYYQAEYHPQGLAVLILILFLYAFLRSRVTVGVSFEILALVFVAGLVFVHHFSSLFIGLLAIGFLGAGFLTERSPLKRVMSLRHGETLRADLSLWTLVSVGALGYLFYYYPDVVQGFVSLLERATPAAVLFTTGPGVPLAATAGNAMKWGVLLLALFAVWKLLGSLTTKIVTTTPATATLARRTLRDASLLFAMR